MKKTIDNINIHDKTTVRLDFRFIARIYIVIWLTVVLFAATDLSGLTNTVEFSYVAFLGLGIPLFFSLGYFLLTFIANSQFNQQKRKSFHLDVSSLRSKTTHLTYFFVIFATFEFVVEGYVPLISMINGADISHFEFGIQSIHGFLMSFGALLFTCWFIIYNIDKKSRAKCLFFMFLIICFFALSVTRKMIVVVFIQVALVSFTMRKRNSFFLKLAVYSLLCILVFGLIGDIRTGRDLFIELSRIPNYPSWLPSGFGWVFIYITTPLLNLANAYSFAPDPTFDLSFMLKWLPSFIRSIFIDNDRSEVFLNFWQISGAFNVGSGFMSMYLSFGTAGIFIFSFITGFLYKFLFLKVSNISWYLVFIIYTSCVYLLIFNNNFFNLNTVSQMLFAFLLLKNKRAT